MKPLIILFLISITFVSCTKNKQTEEITEGGDNTEVNLIDNEKKIENIQTRGLQNGDVVAIIKTTNGPITLRLFTKLVPLTTTNFIALAKNKYYENVIFHRIIKGFMIQGGDPDGTGRGGESIYGESFADEFNPDLKNISYSISMANAGPNTNGSQFFINQANNNFLDNKHSVFGQVVEGIENIEEIANVKTNSNDKPEEDIKIISIEIKQYNDGSYSDYDFDIDTALNKIEEDKQAEIEAKKLKAVEAGDNISVHYTGAFENGEIFDSSLNRKEVLSFEVGAQQMIPGFDAGVVGMKIGDKKSLKLSPKEAYGELETSFPRAALESFEKDGTKLKAGEVIKLGQGDIKIIDVKDSVVIIENNHPLAGKTLNFDIELISIN